MAHLFKEVSRAVYADFVKYHVEHYRAKDNAIEADTMSAMQTHIDGSVIAQAVYTKREGQPVSRNYEVRVLQVNDVKKRVEAIKAAQNDGEHAASLEDRLLYDVLYHCAHGLVEDATKCQKLALEVQSLTFDRY